jgi:hypothetical protein
MHVVWLNLVNDMIAGVKTEEPGVVVCVTASIGQGIIRPIKAKTTHPPDGGGAGACVAATSGSHLFASGFAWCS